MANGTGFFISGKGHFITARHVVEGVEVEKMWLEQHRDLSKEAWAGGLVQWPELVEEWPEFDLVVLKADFKRNANKSHLAGLDAFPHVEVELERVADGTPVYSFGYPLPENMAPMEVEGVRC